MHSEILFEIAVAIIAATVFAFLAKWLRQPPILGYLAAGILIGPTHGLGLVSSPQDIETISELGLILLLFMIGLEIDLRKLRKAGRSVVAVGIGQFVICFGLGLAFMPGFGFLFGKGSFPTIYLAVATSLSSTMIVVKLLYDKFELETLPGGLTLGVLVFQDIWAIFFLALQPNLQHPAPLLLVLSVAKGIGLVAFALLVSRYVLPVLFKSIAKLPELLLIGALAWCFSVAILAAKLGLSLEMGALIAGVSISTFPYNLDVIAKVISLRDFFITLFFVTLGTKIPRPSLELVLTALVLSFFLVVTRFLSITPILYWLGNGNRASFIPALNLSQISEFSLVICTLGIGYGHVDQRILSLMVYIFAITSIASTYGILRNHEIFKFVNPLLKQLGMRDLGDEGPEGARIPSKPIVFLGFFRHASSLLHELLFKDPALAGQVAVVDFNPYVKEELDRRGITAVYGDVSHADTLHHAHIEDARVLLGTIPDSILKGTSNARLLRQLLAMAPKAQIIVTAETVSQARELYQAGASFVFIPRWMSVRELRDVVLVALQRSLDQERRTAHAELEIRSEVLP